MITWLTRYRILIVFLVVAIYLFFSHPSDPSATSFWLRPASLLAMGIAFSGTRLRVKSCEGALAVSHLFLFGAVISLPALPGVLAVAAAVAVAFWFEKKGRHSHVEFIVRVAVAALSATLARFVYDWGAEAGRDLLALSVSSAVFLALNGISGALEGRLAYWRRLLPARTLRTAKLGLIFTPAAMLIALVFDPNLPPMLSSVLWNFAPFVLLFYLACEWRLGPLYEDPQQKAEMDQVYLRAVEALALAVEAKDRVSGTHLKRVQHYSVEIAKALNCSEEEIRALEFGSLLHDIGKIAVPEELLTKPSRLSPQEFSQVASHAEIGAEILSAVNFPFPVAEVVLSHHENWDGTGYPRRLKGEEIPLPARILTVVDNFDALTTDRPYRAALTSKQAAEFIKARRGKAFDPKVADTLLELLPRLERELRQDPAFRRGMTASRFSLKSPRSIEANQTALTYEERLESLKQARTVARESATAAEFASLHRLLSSLAAGLSQKELLEFLLPLLKEKIPFDECTVFMVEGSVLMPVYCSGPKGDLLRNLQVPVGDSPSGWVAAHGRTLLNGNPAGEHADLGTMASLQGLKSALVAPLWSTGSVVGTFNLYSKTPGLYSEQHAVLIENVTRKLGRPLVEASMGEFTQRKPLDPLTALPTARETLLYLRSAVREASESRQEVSVLTADVDYFRIVSSLKGSPAGDKLLLMIAQTLRASQRNFQFLGRLGDDRFVAVLHNCPQPRLESLVKQFKQVVWTKCQQPEFVLKEPLSVSVGAATYPTDALGPERLLEISYQRAYLEKINRAGITLSLPEPSLASPLVTAAV